MVNNAAATAVREPQTKVSFQTVEEFLHDFLRRFISGEIEIDTPGCGHDWQEWQETEGFLDRISFRLDKIATQKCYPSRVLDWNDIFVRWADVSVWLDGDPHPIGIFRLEGKVLKESDYLERGRWWVWKFQYSTVLADQNNGANWVTFIPKKKVRIIGSDFSPAI